MNEGLLYLNPSLSASVAPVPRAQPRHAAARALRRLLLPARHRPRRPPRRPRRPGRQPRHHDQRDRRPSSRRWPSRSSSCRTSCAAPTRPSSTCAPTLDDLDPLVDDSKPVAKKLRPFLAELRPLARDARPTLQRPQRARSSSPARQRPDRAHERPGAAARRRRRATSTRTARSAPAPSRPRPRRSRTPRRRSAYIRPVHGRPARLVRRLQPLRHLRRARRRLARRHPRERVRACSSGQLTPVPAGAARRGLPGRRGDRPAQPLPGRRRPQVRGRLAALEADAGLQLRPEPDAPGRLMRRLLVIALVLAAGAAAVVASRRRRLAGPAERRPTRSSSTTRSGSSRAPTSRSPASAPGTITGMRVDRRTQARAGRLRDHQERLRLAAHRRLLRDRARSR